MKLMRLAFARYRDPEVAFKDPTVEEKQGRQIADAAVAKKVEFIVYRCVSYLLLCVLRYYDSFAPTLTRLLAVPFVLHPQLAA